MQILLPGRPHKGYWCPSKGHCWWRHAEAGRQTWTGEFRGLGDIWIWSGWRQARKDPWVSLWCDIIVGDVSGLGFVFLGGWNLSSFLFHEIFSLEIYSKRDIWLKEEESSKELWNMSVHKEIYIYQELFREKMKGIFSFWKRVDRVVCTMNHAFESSGSIFWIATWRIICDINNDGFH